MCVCVCVHSYVKIGSTCLTRGYYRHGDTHSTGVLLPCQLPLLEAMLQSVSMNWMTVLVRIVPMSAMKHSCHSLSLFLLPLLSLCIGWWELQWQVPAGALSCVSHRSQATRVPNEYCNRHNGASRRL